MAEPCGKLKESLFAFQKSTECPELFMSLQEDKREIFKSISKSLYDIVQLEVRKENIQSKGLPKLIIKNFDDEQIWQQIDLQNNILSFYNKQIKKLENQTISLGIDIGNHVEKNSVSYCSKKNAIKNELDISDSNEEDYSFDGSDSDDINAPEVVDRNACTKLNKLQNYSSKAKPSKVDDQFFKLSELEEFLKIEDLKHEKGLQDLSDGSDDLEYFEDIPSDDEGVLSMESHLLDPREKNKKKSARNLMYKDFFGPPCDQVEVTKKCKSPNANDEVESFCSEDDANLEDMENEMEDEYKSVVESETVLVESNDHTSPESNLKPIAKTAFEIQQEKERKKMRELEESLLKDKPWQLTGEVAAASRPKDSLVYQETEFDCNAKHDLVVTDEFESKIENIIKMVIRNKAWNDVERKVKPLDDTTPFKAPVEVDQSKSKKSLAELYEDDFLKKQQKEKTEDPKHIEIKKMMDLLLPRLSSLFCHIPKPPIPEMKVVTNLPAISVEEVAPVSVSDAALLAPEEIRAKPAGIEIGKSERTDTDKKRERRKKKRFQKFQKLQEEDKKRKDAVTSVYAARKYEKSEATKKIRQNKNTIIVDGKKGTKIKSSKDFFSKLQDTVSLKTSFTNK